MTAPSPPKLHVPSPDWRDQVIYFLVTDRFDDDDPANNDQGAGEFDPSQTGKYSGGDLRGIERRIDYIRQLGATAVWITPPVANQWPFSMNDARNPEHREAGIYHWTPDIADYTDRNQELNFIWLT